MADPRPKVLAHHPLPSARSFDVSQDELVREAVPELMRMDAPQLAIVDALREHDGQG